MRVFSRVRIGPAARAVLPVVLLGVWIGLRGASASPAGLVFREISGACQSSPERDLLWKNALGWDRLDLGWAECEPAPGQWNQAALEKYGQRVLAFRQRNARVLPVLLYNAPWSWDHSERTFEHGNTRRHVLPRPDGRFDVILSRREGGEWKETKREVMAGEGRWPLAAEHQKEWEAYVRRAVSFLHAPPYNVEYFQIWNEAHPESGFWFGDLDTYMERVHLPAARIIRSLGAKVVYGGWPCCGSLDEYLRLLEKHRAWDTLDVLDVHYFPVSAWQRLADAAQAHGGRGIWQTEVGFTADPTYVANTYPRFFHWALTRPRRPSPDTYKLFLFAYWSPDDPKAYGYRRCLFSGNTLSAHGKSLQTLGDLFGSEPARAYADVSTEPALAADLDEKKSSLEGFARRGRLVLAIHLAPEGRPETVVVHLPKVKPSQVRSAARVSATGERTELKGVADARRGTRLEVPAGEPGAVSTFYVAVELAP